MAPPPDPGAQAATATELESDGRRHVKLRPREIIELSPPRPVGTAVVVRQMSVGASLKAAIEYLTGTLGGAAYAGVIAALAPHANEVSLLVALAIAVAPLALLAAINHSFRAGPLTAVTVVVGSPLTHSGPVESALYRVLEVATLAR